MTGESEKEERAARKEQENLRKRSIPLERAAKCEKEERTAQETRQSGLMERTTKMTKKSEKKSELPKRN